VTTIAKPRNCDGEPAYFRTPHLNPNLSGFREASDPIEIGGRIQFRCDGITVALLA
jgi:hypothetical protein